jgi:hypothetical protein
MRFFTAPRLETVGAGFIQKFGVSDPLAAFGGVSPLQGGRLHLSQGKS